MNFDDFDADDIVAPQKLSHIVHEVNAKNPLHALPGVLAPLSSTAATTTATATTTNTDPNNPTTIQPQQKLQLSKGFATLLRPKVSHDAVTDSVVPAAIIAQHFHTEHRATDTIVDRLVQQQLDGKSLKELRQSAYGEDLCRLNEEFEGKNKKSKKNAKKRSFDWDEVEDTANDQFSISGMRNIAEKLAKANSGAENGVYDVNGSLIRQNNKKQRMNHIIKKSDGTTVSPLGNGNFHDNNNNTTTTNNNNNNNNNANDNNNNNNNTQQDGSSSEAITTTTTTTTQTIPINDLNPMVQLGMEDDEIIHVNTKDLPLLGPDGNPLPTALRPTHNLIANSLGMNRDEKATLLQLSHHKHAAGSHNDNDPMDKMLMPRRKNGGPTKEEQINWRDRTLVEMGEKDWKQLLDEFRIVTTGVNIPHPLRAWSDLNLYNISPELMLALNSMGYQDPTPIQRIAMPVSFLNRDVLARSQTGSGKTCSFLIPVLTYIQHQPPLNKVTCLDGPYAIILAPARELATQIYEEAQKMLYHLPEIRAACVIGGSKGPVLEDKFELIIATPGRLMDVLNQRALVLNQCRYIILDEADKMLDEGFEPQLIQILEAMPSHLDNNNNNNTNNNNNNDSSLMSRIFQSNRRRTMLYSATFNQRIEELAQKYMQKDYVKIEIGYKLQSKVNPAIEQIIEYCYNEDNRMEQLCKYLNDKNWTKCIIFCARKEHCDQLFFKIRDLANNRGGRNSRYTIRGSSTGPARPVVLHSDSADREVNLRGFKEGMFNILIATDVAGRGIDVKDVGLVINYGLPDIKPFHNPTGSFQRANKQFDYIFEAYTHRVGRTGRGVGNTGTAVTFLGDAEKVLMPQFKQFLQKNGVKRFPKMMEDVCRQHEESKILW